MGHGDTINLPDKDRPVRAPISLWLTIIGLALGGGAALASLQARVNLIEPLAVKVEALSQQSSKLDVMANDIQWIKAELQRQREQQLRRSP